MHLNHLTNRQLEILNLLSSGASNQEIADQLAISLGTVKQHLSLIYKRLNIKNRAMAVSLLSSETQADQDQDSLYIRKPCVAISISVAGHIKPSILRQMQTLLAGLSFDYGMHFLSRNAHQADLVLGMGHDQSSSLANTIAEMIYQFTAAFEQVSAEVSEQLQLAIVAGLAVVEADYQLQDKAESLFASSVLADSRELLQHCQPGRLRLSARALQLLQAEGLFSGLENDTDIKLSDWQSIYHLPALHALLPDERRAKLEHLEQQLSVTAKQLLVIQGEKGMGKSFIAAKIIDTLKSQRHCLWFQCMQNHHQSVLLELFSGRRLQLNEFTEFVSAQKTDKPLLLMFDDMHLLSAAQMARLMDCYHAANDQQWIIAGRHIQIPEADEQLQLSRLTDDSTAMLVRQIQPSMPSSQLQQIIRLSAGVPLFAMQLLRYPAEKLPFALLVIVYERLSRFRFDWRLLCAIANAGRALSFEQLQEGFRGKVTELHAAVEQAHQKGLLRLHNDQSQYWVAIKHPLVEKVIAVLCLGWRAETQR